LTFLYDKISSISHSSLPSMLLASSIIFNKSGGGLVLLLYGSSKDMWKVLCIFHFCSSDSHIAVGKITFSMVNRPCFLWSSLSFGYLVWMCFPSNITRSPILNSGVSLHLRLAYLFILSWVAFRFLVTNP
jgi:hypothetical protein